MVLSLSRSSGSSALEIEFFISNLIRRSVSTPWWPLPTRRNAPAVPAVQYALPAPYDLVGQIAAQISTLFEIDVIILKCLFYIIASII